MSSPMPGTLFVQRCREAGLRVVEMNVDGKSWLNNNRNQVGPWSDVHGITEHHTGSDTTDPLSYAKFLFRGSSALIGPLCQFSTAPDGTIYMIGWGRCNHAGGGDPLVRDALLNDTVPYDRELKPTKGNSDGVDGNRLMYGNEIMYSGSHPMTEQQSRSSTIAYGIICKYHGWRGNSVIAHREWSDDKPDPGFQSLPARRKMVDQWLDGTFGGTVDMTDVNIVSMNEQVYERIAWWVLVNYKFPMIQPVRDENGNPVARPGGTYLAERGSWNEEYTFRAANEAAARTIAAIGSLEADIKQAIADDPDADVDPAVVERAVAAAFSKLTATVSLESPTETVSEPAPEPAKS